jgi:hypothetical protein
MRSSMRYATVSLSARGVVEVAATVSFIGEIFLVKFRS